MDCWTKWLKENIAKLKEDPEGNLSDLLQNCIDERDKNFGWTVTHALAASSEGLGIEVMEFLFKFLENKDRKTQLLMKDKDGDIPIQSAIRSNAPKNVIELFMKLDTVRDMLCSHNKKNQSPLLTAFDLSHWDAVEVLLDQCIEYGQLTELTGVNAPAELKHNTILHRAFKRGNVKYFEIFLRVCAVKGIRDEQLSTAVLISNKRDETPWYYAIRFLTIEALELVLQSVQRSTIDINSLYTDVLTKSTMLHVAHRIRKSEHCDLLVQYGAAMEQKDANGLYPRDRNRLVVLDEQNPVDPNKEVTDKISSLLEVPSSQKVSSLLEVSLSRRSSSISIASAASDESNASFDSGAEQRAFIKSQDCDSTVGQEN